MTDEKIYVVCEFCSTVNILSNTYCSTCNSPLTLPDYLKKEHEFLMDKIRKEKEEAERLIEINRPFWEQDDYVTKGSKAIREHYHPHYLLPRTMKYYSRIEKIKEIKEDIGLVMISSSVVFLTIVLTPLIISISTSITHYFQTFISPFGFINILTMIMSVIMIGIIMTKMMSTNPFVPRHRRRR